MRKLIKLALVALGIKAFLHWRKSRHETTPAPTAEPTADPADDLRRKLAESRDEDELATVEEKPAEGVADRRADVHGQGRSTLDEMNASNED